MRRCHGQSESCPYRSSVPKTTAASLRERHSSFSSLFGDIRGVPGREREPWPSVTVVAPLLEILLGREALPAGLTLLVGGAASGKTVIAAALAYKLAASGEAVAYLDCDLSNVQALVAAQIPAAQFTNYKEILFTEPARGTVLGEADNIATFGHAQTIIIDSLTHAFAASGGDRIDRDLQRLAEDTRNNGISVLATCTAAILEPSPFTNFELASIAELVLRTRSDGTLGGPQGAAVFCIEVHDEQSSRQARLRIDTASSLITIT